MIDTHTTVPVATVTSRRLYARLLQNEPLVILDVRNPDDFARRRIEGRDALQVINIPYYAFIEDEDSAAAQIPLEREIIVVCAKTGSSQYVAETLQQRGVRVSYLEGGIGAWGAYYDTRDIISGPWGRIVQITRPARGDVSFVVISDGQAAIVDPLRHIDYYTSVVADAGARVTLALDTHVHADHISGGPALAQRTGAPYYVHAYDAIHPIDMLPATIAYTSLEDGQRFSLGQVTLTARWFPGHTLGQMNFHLAAPDGVTALFTGDGVFLRSFGRPDLGGKGEAWTPMLYESLYRRLPDYVDDATLILPAHFSALDEGDAEGRFAASYGDVKRENEALAPRTLEAFTDYVLSNLPVFPSQYVEIKRVNIGLVTPSEEQADELEVGKNICALG